MQEQAAQATLSKAALLSERQRLDSAGHPASVDQVLGQMRALVERVMGEAGLYAPEHAAIAVKQAHGDSVEASAILRAYRQSVPRAYLSEIIDTEGMLVERRISSAFREIPGGQILGPTRDYTQRLLEERIAWEDRESCAADADRLESELGSPEGAPPEIKMYPRVSDLLKAQGLVKPVNEEEDRTVADIARQPIRYPAPRSAALQTLARAETGGMMALGYSAMRGQGGDHPTIGELRVGWVRIQVKDRRGRIRSIGRIRITESANISKIKTRKKDPVPYMSLGYGLCFGQNETKAICMGILDRSMRIPGDGAPAISQEFVLYHLEGPDSHGYLQSLKMPAHTEFQSEIGDLRAAIQRHQERKTEQATDTRSRRKAQAEASEPSVANEEFSESS